MDLSRVEEKSSILLSLLCFRGIESNSIVHHIIRLFMIGGIFMNWQKSTSSTSSNHNDGFIPCEIRDNNNVVVYDKIKFIVSDEWASCNGNLDFSKKSCYNAVSVFTGIGAVKQNKIQFSIFQREDGFSCGIAKELRNGSKDWKTAIKTLGIDSESYERITDAIIDAWLEAGQKRQWKSWGELKKKK